MSLIDDFLMNEVIGNEEHGGEVIDYFLQVVLGQKIEVDNVQVQRIQTTGDESNRGIRLDIRTKISLYQAMIANNNFNGSDDSTITNNTTVGIEMHNNKSETKPGEQFDIRRRSRLYQSIIDVNMLKTGDDFGDLDDVLIIVCTSFDVFGRDRYKYTFTNMCHEEDGLLLDDGAYRIFLNTKGKYGGSNELQELLNYAEHSDIKNATNKNLKKLHTIVSKIKKSKEARDRYMWEFEKLKRERIEGREEARAEYEGIITEINSELNETKTELGKKDAEIAALKKQLAAKD